MGSGNALYSQGSGTVIRVQSDIFSRQVAGPKGDPGIPLDKREMNVALAMTPHRIGYLCLIKRHWGAVAE